LAAGLEKGVYRFHAAKALSKHKDKNYDSSFIHAVNTAFDWVAATYADLNDVYGDAVLMVEEYVNPQVSEAPGDAGGYLDIAIYSLKARTLVIADYKHGYKDVDITTARQPRQYAAGLLYGDGQLKPSDFDLITLVIVQPNSFHKDGIVREVDLSPVDVLEYLFELDEIIKKSKEPDAPLIPGEYCKYCDGNYACPALQAKAVQVINPEFNTPEDIQGPKIPDVKSLPPARISYILQALPLLKNWIDGVESYAYEMLNNGKDVPGFKLVEAKAKRHWNGDPDDIAPKLAALIGCDTDKLFSQKFITITEAERKVKDAFKKRVAKKKRKLAAEDAGKQFAYFTTKESSGNLTLVPEEDGRQAVNSSRQVFEGVGYIQPPKEN
jgi:hypothetical protein